MITLCFFILPFTYFYADETLETEADDMDLTNSDYSDDEELS